MWWFASYMSKSELICCTENMICHWLWAIYKLVDSSVWWFTSYRSKSELTCSTENMICHWLWAIYKLVDSSVWWFTSYRSKSELICCTETMIYHWLWAIKHEEPLIVCGNWVEEGSVTDVIVDGAMKPVRWKILATSLSLDQLIPNISTLSNPLS